jgi:hypothetical protein
MHLNITELFYEHFNTIANASFKKKQHLHWTYSTLCSQPLYFQCYEELEERWDHYTEYLAHHGNVCITFHTFDS